MNWLDARYAQERREDEIRAVQQEAEAEALLAGLNRRDQAKRKNVRRAFGSKLVEWGERLQEQPLSKTATLKG